jgi:hypothetical protein
MKVRISHTVDITAEERLAIGHRFGVDRPATRAEVTEFFLSEGFDVDLKEVVRERYASLAEKYSQMAGEK